MLYTLSCVLAQIVIIDDVPGIEQHNGVLIDSTRNNIDHIVQKIKHRRYSRRSPKRKNTIMRVEENIPTEYHSIPKRKKTLMRISENIPTEYYIPKKYIQAPPQIVQVNERTRYRYSYPVQMQYTLARRKKAPVPRRPRIRRTYKYLQENDLDRQIEELLKELNRIKSEETKYEINSLKLQGKRAALKNTLLASHEQKKKIESSLLVSKEELSAVQTELELLKSRVQNMSEQSFSLSQKEDQIQNEINQIQKRFKSKSKDFAERLAEIKIRLQMLRQQYSINSKEEYVEQEILSSSSTDPVETNKYF